MKQLLLLMGMLFSLILLSLPSYSQNRPTITRVSKDGKMTVYDQVNCLVDAVNDATGGDKLYLSAGTFSTNSGSLRVLDKKIAFIGSGIDTKIIANVTYGQSDNSIYYDYYNMTLFNGIKLKNLSFSGYSNLSLKHINIKNCQIDSIVMDHVSSASIENCKINGFLGNSSCTTELKNCKLQNIHARGLEFITNCNIANYHCEGTRYVSSCIIGNLPDDIAGNTFMEYCIIPQATSEDADIRDCYRVSNVDSILDMDTLEAKVDLKDKGYLGADGSEVGIYGGLWTPYTELPSVPTVDAKKSSVEYDPTANKLKVNIQMLKESK